MIELDRDTLEAALIGYEYQKTQIETKIEQLRDHLRGHVGTAPTAPAKKKGRRKFSAETRKRMAAAQQRRWAAKSTKTAKRTPLSAEARERIAAAQRKRWATARKAAK